MKKSLCKVISLFLSALMLLSLTPVFSFAADSTSEPAAPTISIEKLSETKTQVVIAVKLTANSFACLDIKIDAIDSLTLTGVVIADELFGTSNTDNGMLSIVSVDGCNAPFDVAEYVYTKSAADGITAADFEIEILACYIDTEVLSEDISASVTVNNAIPATHTHVSGEEWFELEPATCSAKGTEVLYCTECGQISAERETEKTAHKNTSPEHLDAGCDTEGYDKVYCNDCKQYISETIIPVTGHVNTHIETDDPSCTEDGETRTVCACGEIISTQIIPATGHVDTHIERTEASCTAEGAIKTVCSCGEVVKTEIIPITHKDITLDIKAPTCQENGYKKEICSCGEVVSFSELEKIDHTYITDIQKETCTEDGYLKVFCTMCSDVNLYTTFKKTGHRWLDWETLREPSYSTVGIERRICDACGVDEERAIDRLIAKPTELILSMEEINMNFKQVTRLFVNILPEEATYSTEVVWESSNTSVATVDEDGTVHAVGIGTATITATSLDGTVTDSCQVTVKYSILQWIIVYILFGWIWYI